MDATPVIHVITCITTHLLIWNREERNDSTWTQTETFHITNSTQFMTGCSYAKSSTAQIPLGSSSHVSTQHDTSDVSSASRRACWACRAVLFYKLDKAKCMGSTRVVSRRDVHGEPSGIRVFDVRTMVTHRQCTHTKSGKNRKTKKNLGARPRGEGLGPVSPNGKKSTVSGSEGDSPTKQTTARSTLAN